MSYNFEDLSVNGAKDLLRKWREGNERRSDDVLELWTDCGIGENINKLGNEKHVVLEQVIYAALDCHVPSIAKYCIALLKSEFPGSIRVSRYQAMKLEAEGRYDEALEILNHIIEKVDETNAAARKRRAAIYKAQGQTALAIVELVNYLKMFMSDAEAWQELCSLYLREGEHARAVFCAEELLLHQPHNHLFAQRVAEMRYTMGGTDNLELAKSYYCQALKLNPDNMRALLGLILVTNSLLSHYKSSGHAGKRKEAWRLSQWAAAAAARKKEDSSGHNMHQMILALSITE